MPKTLVILLGPTGIGKTDLSIDLAKQLNSPIISCDSRQFYKELKIGTAIPTNEQLNRIKHYFIGNKSVSDYYNVFLFETEAITLINNLFKKQNALLMVGGSGMYVDVICHGIDDIPDIDPELRKDVIVKYEQDGIDNLRFDLKKMDPEYYKSVDLRNKNRMLRAIEVKLQTGKTLSSFRRSRKKNREFNILKIGLERDRKELYERINRRVDLMVQDGLIQEAHEMLKYKKFNALNTVGYKELFEFFDDTISQEKAIDLIKRNSRRYAKRQITWFRRDKDIHWFNPQDQNKIIEFVKNEIKNS